MKGNQADIIRKKALELGFEAVGISKAEKLEEEAKRLEDWLNQGLHGGMSYMENHFEKRIDPRKLVPGAKSVISLIYNYFPEAKQNQDSYKLSKYAFGEDYHFVIKRKLKSLLAFIQEEIGEVSGRCFVDSAPVMERDWAKRSGLGWIGKNTLLINPKKGSFYFLAELIIDLELPIDHPMDDFCGTCTKCIDACPTNAIAEEGFWLDASKCISYLTIELREAIPNEFENQMEDWMFGCDICQDVCPWNRFSKPHQEEQFMPKEEILNFSKQDWLEISDEVFASVFKKSAVKRTGYEGLKRNIKFLND